MAVRARSETARSQDGRPDCAPRGAALRRPGALAEAGPRPPGPDAAEPALRLPDLEAALRPLHAGDGRAGVRLAQRQVHSGRRSSARELGPRTHERIRLCGGVDPAHVRRADDQLLRAAAAAPGQRRPPRRGSHGAARSRGDPRHDRRAHAVPQHSRLHERALGAAAARVAARLHGGGDGADELLRQPAQVSRLVPEVDVRRRRDGGQRLRIRLASQDLGGSLPHRDVAAMAEGQVKGMCCVGQNPATSLNGGATRLALRELDWLVVKDNWLTETASYWYQAPEVKDGRVHSSDIRTEIFFFPSTQIAEYDGSFTNTPRMLQWHSKSVDAPGDCRTDTWFYHNLAKRLKKAYAASTAPRDQGWNNLLWDFDPDPGVKPIYPGEPDALKVLREINGYMTADPHQHLPGFAALKDDGSTTCASWIYCGCYPAPDQNMTARREPDPPGVPGAHLKWGWAWPANRRVMYNRASADL